MEHSTREPCTDLCHSNSWARHCVDTAQDKILKLLKDGAAAVPPTSPDNMKESLLAALYSASKETSNGFAQFVYVALPDKSFFGVEDCWSSVSPVTLSAACQAAGPAQQYVAYVQTPTTGGLGIYTYDPRFDPTITSADSKGRAKSLRAGTGGQPLLQTDPYDSTAEIWYKNALQAAQSTPELSEGNWSTTEGIMPWFGVGGNTVPRIGPKSKHEYYSKRLGSGVAAPSLYGVLGAERVQIESCKDACNGNSPIQTVVFTAAGNSGSLPLFTLADGSAALEQ